MLTRRTLLQRGLSASAILPALSPLSLGKQPPGMDLRDSGKRCLVVLQLTGGNDGLNTVVPHAQDAYYRMRPNLGLAKGGLHALDEGHGLHPSLTGLGELYQEGQLAVVQGVGYPGADRSHFRSLEVWHTAAPHAPAGDTGWLGRLADALAKDDEQAMPALAVEPGDLPLSMRGRHVMPPTVRDPRGFQLHAGAEQIEALRDELLGASGVGEVDYLRRVARTTYDTARRMGTITAAESKITYPDGELAQRFRLVAQLLRGGFGTRIFHLSFGGFDTHSRQAPVHANLLTQVSGALTAFQRDLVEHGLEQQVVTLVFSEFGRRARENASKGTDHGQGAPVFLMGAPVKGGMHGHAPDLDALVDGDVPGSLDFRGIYTQLEQGWLGQQPSSDTPAMQLLE